MMHLRTLTLVAACGALAWGGYEVSHLRAGTPEPRAFHDVLAAAGSEQGYAGGEGQGDDKGYRLSSLSVFSNVAIHVKDNYVEPERIKPKEMLISALQGIERQVAEVLVEELGSGRLSIKVMNEEKVLYVDDVESLWEINLKLREVFRFLEKHLPPQKDLRAIEYAAVNGALSTLDPHSVLLKPEAFAEMKTSTKGEFGGLGIVISVRDSKLTIISPLDGTPAHRAGLKAGDVISRIGEVSTVSMPIEEAVRMLRGPEGSRVNIWIDRKGWPESKKFNIVRERIKIESVEGKLLSSNVGYIKIKNFQQNTGKDLEDKLESLAKQAGGKLTGVVLDLRNNPGGLLEQAIRVSDKFLTSGDIVTTVGYGNKLREPKRARWAGTEADLPIAVLVNKGSASASEIVAGALKNLDRAVIVGERTFGKGSVQVLYDFADSSALKLTIAQYLTPGGVSIQNEGVSPDIALKPAWIEEKVVRLYYEPEGHREMNLDKHLERAGSEPSGEQRAAFELTYLVEKKAEGEEAPGEDEEDAEAAAEASAVQEDYQIKFARDLLTAAGRSSRAKMIQASKDYLAQRKLGEEQKIVERMQSLGVSWATAAGAPRQASKVEARLELEGNDGGAISAGDEIRLIATVRNVGTEPLHRVRGLLESEHPAFVGRELLFGEIAPGESRSWTIYTKVPKEAASRSDLVKLALTAEEGRLADEAILGIVTRHVPHPQFAYSWVIDDRQRGDGDGILEVGEGVDFVVLVTNTGKGRADDVALRLKSAAQEDLFLERGRITVGAIEPGETKVGRLRFRVPKTQSGRDGLPLELAIYDSGTGEWLEDQITLVAREPQADKLAAKKAGMTAKKDTAIYASASDGAAILASAKKGTRVSTLGRAGDLVQVELLEDATGWVRAADLAPAPKSKQAAGKLLFHPGRRPPSIELANDLGGRVVEEELVELTGVVSGRELRDMYVILNDEKVFFATAPKAPEDAPAAKEATTEAPSWAAPDEAAVKLPFRLNLKLKEGLNKVVVVARLDEKVTTYKTIFVSRRPASAPQVAERTERPDRPERLDRPERPEGRSAGPN